VLIELQEKLPVSITLGAFGFTLNRLSRVDSLRHPASASRMHSVDTWTSGAIIAPCDSGFFLFGDSCCWCCLPRVVPIADIPAAGADLG